MNREELVAYLVFGSYFAAIFSSFFLVFRSILSGVDPKRLLHGRPFLFLRTALGALLCTGYCESSFQCFSLRLTIVTSLVQFHQCQLPFCGVPQRADRDDTVVLHQIRISAYVNDFGTMAVRDSAVRASMVYRLYRSEQLVVVQLHLHVDGHLHRRSLGREYVIS